MLQHRQHDPQGAAVHQFLHDGWRPVREMALGHGCGLILLEKDEQGRIVPGPILLKRFKLRPKEPPRVYGFPEEVP